MYIYWFFQCLALIPGTSRSVLPSLGMLNGLNRKASTEFSFFLAIPVMFGAASLDLYKNYKNLYYEDLIIITSGFLISFFTALLAIKLLILYLKNNNFIIFGWYRICIGILLGFIIIPRKIFKFPPRNFSPLTMRVFYSFKTFYNIVNAVKTIFFQKISCIM